MNMHTVKFSTRHGNTADAKAVCTCGWFQFGKLAELQLAAATHDMEWEPIKTEPEPFGVQP